jgi:hypothetical protein
MEGVGPYFTLPISQSHLYSLRTDSMPPNISAAEEAGHTHPAESDTLPAAEDAHTHLAVEEVVHNRPAGLDKHPVVAHHSRLAGDILPVVGLDNHLVEGDHLAEEDRHSHLRIGHEEGHRSQLDHLAGDELEIFRPWCRNWSRWNRGGV